MKIVSYNVNGIRSAMRKEMPKWLQEVKPEVFCIQELKAQPEQFDDSVFEDLGYHTYWHSAEKKGYSGVALLSKKKPDKVEIGCGEEKFDKEGRIIRADFNDITCISLYLPSGSSGDHRQEVKMEFLDFFLEYLKALKKERPRLIISGDFNICHEPIDIHDPIRNAKNSGFLPEEREWFDKLLNAGFTDSFRYLNPSEQKYSWWSFRAQARIKNKGWRIDYNIISDELKNRLKKAEIWNDVVHSDHCPVFIEIS